MLDKAAGATHHKWNDIPEEAMKGTITRKLITGESMMIGQVVLRKGDHVPMHSHHNEQITHILSGALRFTFDDGSQKVVSAGEVLVIPSNVPHEALALEDTVDVDIFSPPREDWLAKTDDYLRND